MVFTFYVTPHGIVAAPVFIKAACASYFALRRALSLCGFSIISHQEILYTFGISYEFTVRPRSREVSFSAESASELLSYADDHFSYPDVAEIELASYPIFSFKQTKKDVKEKFDGRL